MLHSLLYLVKAITVVVVIKTTPTPSTQLQYTQMFFLNEGFITAGFHWKKVLNFAQQQTTTYYDHETTRHNLFKSSRQRASRTLVNKAGVSNLVPSLPPTHPPTCACCGPQLTATTSFISFFSLSLTASSTAISQKGFIECFTPSVTTPVLSGFTRICAGRRW